TRCVDTIFATRLQQALENAGIDSDVTIVTRNAYLGTMEFVVWVDEKAEQNAIDAACAALMAERSSVTITRPATRVSVVDEKFTCVSSGYDLRGQVEDGKCPECAHPYYVVHPKQCSACQAEIPDDFDVCWNCGHEIESPED